MAFSNKFSYQRLSPRSTQLSIILNKQILRYSSSTTSADNAYSSAVPTNGATSLPVSSPLDRMTTPTLMRRLLMCTFFSSPLLFSPGLAVLKVIANSKTRILNPDQNKLLRKLVKPLVYDQFCAGTNLSEVQNTVSDIKGLGFSGVALCYGKEAYADSMDANKSITQDPDIQRWKEGTLETLDMVGSGDWLGIKITGAGPRVMKALVQNEKPTSEYLDAMNAICEKALARGCRIWIDGEQQAVQASIDSWTIDLMRHWNKGPSPLVYNTLQSYLKESRPKLQHQLALAHKEGWTYAFKLVRGAYIVQDRPAIHNTKEETDESYESIFRDMFQGTLPGFSQDSFPKFEMLLAGHNPGTIARASALAQDLVKAGKLKVHPEFAQLQGMADDVGCALLSSAEKIKQSSPRALIGSEVFVPRVYKCLTWGTIQECMQYLVRRAVENRGAADRIKDDAALFGGELRRRFAAAFRG